MPHQSPNDIPPVNTPTSAGEADGTSATVSEKILPPPIPSPVEALGQRGRRFLLSVLFVTLITAQAWVVLVRGAIDDALYSYTILIPCISAWLIRQNQKAPPYSGVPNPFLGWGLIALAAVCALAGIAARRSDVITTDTSWLTTQMSAWVLGIWGVSSLHLGWEWLRQNRFAAAFLVFTIPLPDPAILAIEFGLQSASATASDWLFHASGTPYLRDGMAFWLPNIHILVARECSGIRSTLVLLITGILGAHLLLRNPIHQLCIALVILPLGVFRNALRILTLTLLSVHVNPEIMNSALHKRGGPLFFAVSLIPLFALFWWFGRRERKAPRNL
jgi:exosortase C (VPDSG-CTERM-specific)